MLEVCPHPALHPTPLAGQAGRGQGLRAPKLLGAWDRQRFSREIGFNSGITCCSSPTAVVLVPARTNTGLTQCLVDEVI